MWKLTLLLGLVALSSAYKSYEGYQLWVIEKTDGVAEFIRRHDISVLSEGKDSVKVLIDPPRIPLLKRELYSKRIDFKVTVPNLERLIELERQRPRPAVYTPTEYNTYDDIVVRLNEVAASFSGSAIVGSIGQSYEGREQAYIVFEGGNDIIYFDCGIHAREWISPATCMYGVDRFADEDPDFMALLTSFTVYILPVFNPDGYEYTFTNDRMWRKNRNQYDGNTCTGVDLNRNFDNHWAGEGTSSAPCSDLYHGPSPASEVETQNGQNFLLNLEATTGKNLLVIHSTHSYSQLWMYAWGYDYNVTNVDEAVLNLCAGVGVDALTAVNGTQYQYGGIAETIYPAAGTTIDFAYENVGCTHSYTLELRDTGADGFELPPEQILITGEETWAGLISSFYCAFDNPGVRDTRK